MLVKLYHETKTHKKFGQGCCKYWRPGPKTGPAHTGSKLDLFIYLGSV